MIDPAAEDDADPREGRVFTRSCARNPRERAPRTDEGFLIGLGAAIVYWKWSGGVMTAGRPASAAVTTVYGGLLHTATSCPF